MYTEYIDGGRSAAPRLSGQQLDDLEKVLGIRLPADYRCFLMEIDGGRPRSGWDDHGDMDIPMIDEFFSVDVPDPGEGRMSLEGYFRLMSDGETLPSGYLPFASDPGGNLYVMSCIPNDLRYGHIYIYKTGDPKVGIIGNEPRYKSFGDLWRSFVRGY